MAKKVKEVKAKVLSVKGECGLGHKAGDIVRFTDGGVDGHICIHALYSMMPKVFAMMFNLPILMNRFSPPIYNGTITDNGVPVPGQEVLLMFFDGSGLSPIDEQVTNADGFYNFTNLPILTDDQEYYYVAWVNAFEKTPTTCRSITATQSTIPTLVIAHGPVILTSIISSTYLLTMPYRSNYQRPLSGRCAQQPLTATSWISRIWLPNLRGGIPTHLWDIPIRTN